MLSRSLRAFLATLTVLLGLFAPASAQNWTRHYDGGVSLHDFSNAVATGADNSIYVAGSSLNPDFNHDIKLLKYGPGGALLWARTFAGPAGDDTPHDVIVRGAYVYVVGRIYSGPLSDYDYVTIKYSDNGVRLWSRVFDGAAHGFDEATHVAVDASDNVYVTGLSIGTMTDRDYVTIKYGPSGAKLWDKRFNGPRNGWEAPAGMVLDGAGNAYVTGAVDRGQPYYTDIHIIKYRSADGATLWSRYHSGPGGITDNPAGIAFARDGSLYVAGTTHRGPTTRLDFVAIKVDPATGNALWSRSFNLGRGTDEYASGLAVDNASNVYVTGTCQYYTGMVPVLVSDILTVKFDARGSARWWRSCYVNDENTAHEIAVSGVGDVYVTGDTFDPEAGYYDLITLHYASDGTLEGSDLYNGPGKRDDYQAFDRSLTVDAAGSAITAGREFVGLNNNDIVTRKFGR